MLEPLLPGGCVRAIFPLVSVVPRRNGVGFRIMRAAWNAPSRAATSGCIVELIKIANGEATMGIEVLVLAFGVYATIWLVVLVGSQFFGPR